MPNEFTEIMKKSGELTEIIAKNLSDAEQMLEQIQQCHPGKNVPGFWIKLQQQLYPQLYFNRTVSIRMAPSSVIDYNGIAEIKEYFIKNPKWARYFLSKKDLICEMMTTYLDEWIRAVKIPGTN
jgi:hypothetical protein